MISVVDDIVSALDALTMSRRSAEIAGTVTGTEALAALKMLKQASSKLDANLAALTHLADSLGAHRGSDARDASEWLAQQTGTSVGKNRTDAKLGEAMARSDELTDAVTTGDISSDVASIVASVAADETVDAELVESVAGLSPKAVKPIVEDWRARQHPDRDADVAATQRARRYLRLTSQNDGMTRIDGLLDPASAVRVRTTVDAIINESAFDESNRSREQRCADALTQLCAAASKGDIAGGRSNARVIVTVPYETVAERAADRGHAHSGSTLDAASVRQVACDAGLHRHITGPGSVTLDFGATNRLVSERQFLALVARDHACRWPGCNIQATWCDAHHIIEWAAGGATDLDNLALFCHHHHHTSHLPGYEVTGDADRIEIRMPNGDRRISRPPGTPRGVNDTRADTIGREQPDEHASAPPPPGCVTISCARADRAGLR